MSEISKLMEHLVECKRQYSHFMMDLMHDSSIFAKQDATGQWMNEILKSKGEPKKWPKQLTYEQVPRKGINALPNIGLPLYRFEVKTHNHLLPQQFSSLTDLFYQQDDQQLQYTPHPKQSIILAQACLMCVVVHQLELDPKLLKTNNLFIDDRTVLTLSTLDLDLDLDLEKKYVDSSNKMNPICHFLLDLIGWRPLLQTPQYQELLANEPNSIDYRRLTELAISLELTPANQSLTEMICTAAQKPQEFAKNLLLHHYWLQFAEHPALFFDQIKKEYWPSHSDWTTMTLEQDIVNFQPKDRENTGHIFVLITDLLTHFDMLKDAYDFADNTSQLLADQTLTHLPTIFNQINLNSTLVSKTLAKQYQQQMIQLIETQRDQEHISSQTTKKLKNINHQLTSQIFDEMIMLTEKIQAASILIANEYSKTDDSHFTPYIKELKQLFSPIINDIHHLILKEISRLENFSEQQHTFQFLTDERLNEKHIEAILEGPPIQTAHKIQAALGNGQSMQTPHPAILEVHQRACTLSMPSDLNTFKALVCLPERILNQEFLSYGPKIQSLLLQALKYGQHQLALDENDLQNQQAIENLKKSIAGMNKLRTTQKAQREKNLTAHKKRRVKRSLPLFMIGGGVLGLSFGLTGAMFALPLEELFLFNTLLVGEEMIVACLAGGSSALSLITITSGRKKLKEAKNKELNNQTVGVYQTQSSEQKTSFAKSTQDTEDAMIRQRTQELRDALATVTGYT